jgi:phage tail protein
MAITIMRLGSWVFGVPGLDFNRLSRRFEYRWHPQERIGSRPAQQFMGPGEETLDIRGVMYPHNSFSGPSAWSALNAMRVAAEGTGGVGTSYPLAATHGGQTSALYLGTWCIRQIRDEQEFFFPNGDPRKVEFAISIVNYGAD